MRLLETYTAKVILDNSKEFEQKLPELQKIGVGILIFSFLL